MKKIAFFILIAALTSCGKDFLKVEPHSFTDAVYWKTPEQAEAALAGVYSPLQDEEALGGEEWCSMEAFSDNGYMNDNYADFIAMSEFRASQNTEGDLSMNSYRSYFKTVKRANDVLVNVPGMTINEAQKTRILGEANFLLGFAYFQLARRYGGLPLYNQADATSSLVRATEAETWAEIELHFQNATAQLSWTHEAGRPGLGAAFGMLAKVYAFEKKWSEAKMAAEEVINSQKHSLFSSYAGLFTIQNEGVSEFLWQLGARFGEYPITPILMLPNNVWNGLHPEPSGVGWRLVSATLDIYKSYQAGDVRKAATVAKRGVDVITYNGSTDILQAPNNQSDVVCVKYNSPYADAYTDWAAGLDVPVLRYADILLIHAEAIMNLNGGGPGNRTAGVAAAATSFNQVRQRAGLASIGAPTFNDLMYERRMELAFEGGERHFDLVRWGMAEQVYNSLAAEGTYKPKRNYIPTTHRLLPYPQQEINNSGGSILQNPGY
jgi:hypothetical protein